MIQNNRASLADDAIERRTGAAAEDRVAAVTEDRRKPTATTPPVDFSRFDLAGAKVLLFANTDWYLFNFRRALIERLHDAGAEVVLASPPGEYADRLTDAGFRHVPVPFDAGSKGLLGNLGLLSQVNSLLKSERPDVAHFFTIKCVLFGGLIARLRGIGRLSAVTGLGHLFTDRRLTTRIARLVATPFYRFALGGKRVEVVFQNEGNQADFEELGLIARGRSHVIRGSGVDCTLFEPRPDTRHGGEEGPLRLLFASRLLVEKGIHELVEALDECRARGLDVELDLAGDIYPGNPSSLSPEEVEALRAHPAIQFHGHVEDVQAHIHESDAVILPSYAEGTPRVLIEAAACGKPLLASDIPGCHGLVVPERNGRLFKARDSRSIVDAIEWFAARRDHWSALGEQSGQIARGHFAEPAVNGHTVPLYAGLLERSAAGADGAASTRKISMA